ncbi:MAG TPA: hypothetical protein VL371_15825 [Gemmataceae bacterium]|nr:hypothetical protein [Gemmataceae bacterium]
MHSLAEVEQAGNEYYAWRSVCQQLERASAAIDINNEPALHAALVLWGEELAQLRSMQDPQLRVKWLCEARSEAPEYQEENAHYPEH